MSLLDRLSPGMAKTGGFALLAFALFFATWGMLANPESMLLRYWGRYLAHLDRKLRMMFIWTPSKYLAYAQMAAAFALIAAQVSVGLPFWYVFVVLVAVTPAWYIERMRQQRLVQIELQLDGFLQALANALKSIPSIASAFQSIAPILRSPLKEEVELAIKEMRVGSTLEQALLNMAGRVGSRPLDAALSAIVIGRQIGGDLPRILETTAETLREMGRLEGVVRTKTAEGKAQMWVLAVFPVLIIAALDWVMTGYFAPLSQSVTGYVIALLAGTFWLASLVVARKVLNVEV